MLGVWKKKEEKQKKKGNKIHEKKGKNLIKRR